jgi:hypothetical protein
MLDAGWAISPGLTRFVPTLGLSAVRPFSRPGLGKRPGVSFLSYIQRSRIVACQAPRLALVNIGLAEICKPLALARGC